MYFPARGRSSATATELRGGCFRIAGGEVFDEAVVIAHVNTKAKIIGEKRPTAIPALTYSENMTIELGGKTVHLIPWAIRVTPFQDSPTKLTAFTACLIINSITSVIFAVTSTPLRI